MLEGPEFVEQIGLLKDKFGEDRYDRETMKKIWFIVRDWEYKVFVNRIGELLNWETPPGPDSFELKSAPEITVAKETTQFVRHLNPDIPSKLPGFSRCCNYGWIMGRDTKDNSLTAFRCGCLFGSALSPQIGIWKDGNGYEKV